MKISQSSSEPIYQQISDQIRDEILTGKRKEGEYLPSIRSLAKELRISVITTMKAYESLVEMGLLTAVKGKGYYVNAADTESIREQHLRKVELALLEAIEAARIAGMSPLELQKTLETLLEMEEY